MTNHRKAPAAYQDAIVGSHPISRSTAAWIIRTWRRNGRKPKYLGRHSRQASTIGASNTDCGTHACIIRGTIYRTYRNHWEH